MLYHQTTTNQTKMNELKIILCYKCELVRPSKSIINLANLGSMAIYLRKLNSMQMQKVQCKCLHAQKFNASVSMHNSNAKVSHILYVQQFFLPLFDMSSQHKCQ